MTIAQVIGLAGKLVLGLMNVFLVSGCTTLFIAGSVVGAGVAVATTAVDVGMAVGGTAVSATSKVVQAAVPGD